MKTYIAAKESFYDDDKQLWYCHVGFNDRGKTLKYDAYATTQYHAIREAEKLANLLNKHELKNVSRGTITEIVMSGHIK